jgi:hypothetical protein
VLKGVCSVSGKVECFIDDPEFHLPSAEGLLSVPLPDVVATVTEHGISAGSEQWSHESQLVYFRLMNYLKFRANYFTEIDQPEAAADAVRQAFSVRSALMIANYKLIPYVLRRRAAGGEIRRRLQDREVLKSFAEEGLLKAVDAYDWKIGARFATFACLCISHEISTGFARLKKLADANKSEWRAGVISGNPSLLLNAMSWEASAVRRRWHRCSRLCMSGIV